MRQAGPAVFVLREVAAAGHVGLGVMRDRLGNLRLVLAAGLMGGSRLPEGQEEKKQQWQHQAQQPQRPCPAILHHGDVRAGLPAPGGVAGKRRG